jgi:hypothetical protein
MTEQEKIIKQALKQYWNMQKVLDSEGYLVKDRYGNSKAHAAVALQKSAFDIWYKLVPRKDGTDANIEDLLSRME